MAGGVIAAPVAALIVRLLPARAERCGRGADRVSNVDTITAVAGITGGPRTVPYVVVALAWLSAVAYALSQGRSEDGGEQRAPPSRRAPNRPDQHRPPGEKLSLPLSQLVVPRSPARWALSLGGSGTIR